MSIWRNPFAKKVSRSPGVHADRPKTSLRHYMDADDFCQNVPEHAISQIVCLVGSPAIRFSDADAIRAYAGANPTWSRSHAVKLLYASSTLVSKQECSLKCVQAIAEDMAQRETIIQARKVEIANAGHTLQLCFATLFGKSARTDIFLLDEPIPFASIATIR
jgi:hypothetical protein